MGGERGMKGWFTCPHESVLTVNVSGAEGLFSLDKFLCFSECGDEGVGEGAGVTTLLFSLFPVSPYLSSAYLRQWSLDQGCNYIAGSRDDS